MTKTNKNNLSSEEKSNLLRELKIVSRSFYLTLRVLPKSIFIPTGIAYLIARYLDTIVDNSCTSIRFKKQYIHEIRKTITPNHVKNSLETLSSNNITADVPNTPIHIYNNLFHSLHSEEQKLVAKVLLEITDGMLLELKKFNKCSAMEIQSLASHIELDTYIYKVAGSVGEFFTELILLHEPKLQSSNTNFKSNIAINFGKALQLTNILRDLRQDLLDGKCYLPKDNLANYNLEPSNLLNYPRHKLENVLEEYLQLAIQYYLQTEEYILPIPKSCPRLRLGALWPILIGIETLTKLVSNNNWPNSKEPIKVSRRWIYLMIMKSFTVIYSDTLLKMLIKRQIKKLTSKI